MWFFTALYNIAICIRIANMKSFNRADNLLNGFDGTPL